ncbi:MAG: multicopper oxidase domain-containing protein, partial [Gemmatimonadales bacterium]
MNPSRREFIQAGAAAAAGTWLHADNRPFWQPPPDVTLRIAPVSVEIAPDHIIHTVGYNGAVPGPLIRMHEGRPVSVELINDTDTPELVHWHGFRIPADIDGAAEEGTPLLEPHATRRYTLVPDLPGTRWVHTHVRGGPDLTRGLYTGQFAPVYIEPRREPGRYDREVFLVTHEWDPLLSSGGEEAGEVDRDTVTWKHGTVPPASPPDPRPNGYEVIYRSFTINGHPLGRGEPIRVKRGERVMFRIVNASATENLQLALPGHQFEVVALDGNPVPTPRKVPALALGTAERIDAVVTMDNPGVWILGSMHDED